MRRTLGAFRVSCCAARLLRYARRYAVSKISAPLASGPSAAPLHCRTLVPRVQRSTYRQHALGLVELQGRVCEVAGSLRLQAGACGADPAERGVPAGAAGPSHAGS